MTALFYLYLRLLLTLGFHGYVYHLTTKWGRTPRMPRRSNAARMVQAALVEHGYHKCLICHWAETEPGEHGRNDNGECWHLQHPQCQQCHMPLEGATQCKYCEAERVAEEGYRQACEDERYYGNGRR